MSCGKIDLDCDKCRLCRNRANVVPGIGSCRSRIVFIGEAPGKDEDRMGEPFVGRAGGILDGVLADMGIGRKDVYISNLVKCRPPRNRRPRMDEIAACSEFISSELREIRPRVVCALGHTAAKNLLETNEDMTRLAGREASTTKYGIGLRVFVAYHPAACLYQRKKLPDFRKHIEEALALAGHRADQN